MEHCGIAFHVWTRKTGPIERLAYVAFAALGVGCGGIANSDSGHGFPESGGATGTFVASGMGGTTSIGGGAATGGNAALASCLGGVPAPIPDLDSGTPFCVGLKVGPYNSDAGAQPTTESCDFYLPTPQLGLIINPSVVQFELQSSEGNEQFPLVNTLADCTATQGGFYYDNPQYPRKFNLCPCTCLRWYSTFGSIMILSGCRPEGGPV